MKQVPNETRVEGKNKQRQSKHTIGQKVFSMYGLMAIIFALLMLSNLAAVMDISNKTNTISTYLSMESSNRGAATAFQQAQLYSNLVYYKRGTEEFDTMCEKLSTAVADVEDNVTAMKQQAAVAGDEDLIRCANDLDTAFSAFLPHCNSILEAAQSGDFDTVETLVAEIPTMKAAAQDAQDIYSQVIAEKRVTAVSKAATKVRGTEIFDVIGIAVFLVILVIAVQTMRRTVTKPAKDSGQLIGNLVEKLQNNEGDLTERIPVRFQDEIGQMTMGVNGFLEQLQGIVRRLKEVSLQLNQSAENVWSEIEGSNESAGNVSATMEQMSASMEEISATLSSIATGSDSVLTDINTMTDRINDGAKLVEEIKTRAGEMHQSTLAGKESTSQAMNEIRTTLTGAVEESRTVEQINELTNEILNIASQTNLLALNASIEAARAGEAGKGFAVVADEIRTLADNSRDTANSIQHISHLVTNAVQRLADNAESMMQFIDDKVMTDYDDFVEIVDQYQTDAENVNEIIGEFSKSTNEINQTMEHMNSGINNIASAVEESARGVTVVAESAVELVEAIGKIQQETENNQAISNQLSEEVNRFANA